MKRIRLGRILYNMKHICIAVIIVFVFFLYGCGAADQEGDEASPITGTEETVSSDIVTNEVRTEKEIVEQTGTNDENESVQGVSLTEPDKREDILTVANPEDVMLHLSIGQEEVTVAWEENETVDAVKELVLSEPLTINMSMYGGFEQVGSVGMSLPRNDEQTTTQAGDIVLYSGSQIVIFYGSNSWAYTRLGHITDKSASELSNLLGNDDVTITIYSE